MNRDNPIVGIDLGTSRSLVAVCGTRGPSVVTDGAGGAAIPSTVAFADGGQVLVGDAAVNQRALNPHGTVEGAKRFIGRSFDELAHVDRAYPFPIVRTDSDGVALLVGGHARSPEDVAAEIIRVLARRASVDLGQVVSRAVVTVPASFGLRQRQATVMAADQAGVQVSRLLLESTAAAIVLAVEDPRDATVAVFDVGGGTLNVSMIQIGGGVVEVLSTTGEAQAGGEEFTEALAQLVADRFHRMTGVDVRLDPIAMQRVREGAETAKVSLTSVEGISVVVPAIARSTRGFIDLRVAVSRSEFDSAASHLFARHRRACERVLRESRVSIGRVSGVMLVGGSSRIPKLQRIASESLGCDRFLRRSNPDESVAVGAAIQAGVLMGVIRDLVVLEQLPCSVGIIVAGGHTAVALDKHRLLPASSRICVATAVEGQRTAVVVLVEHRGTQVDRPSVLGWVEIDEMTPGPVGSNRIEVEVLTGCDLLVSIAVVGLSSGRVLSSRLASDSPVLPAEAAVVLDRARTLPVQITA